MGARSGILLIEMLTQIFFAPACRDHKMDEAWHRSRISMHCRQAALQAEGRLRARSVHSVQQTSVLFLSARKLLSRQMRRKCVDQYRAARARRSNARQTIQARSDSTLTRCQTARSKSSSLFLNENVPRYSRKILILLRAVLESHCAAKD